MAPVRTTTLDLGRARARWAERHGVKTPPSKSGPRGGADTRLTEISTFGANPGALRMFAYAPKSVQAGSALVVVLHGCTQDAVGYDRHSGWSALADELGFVVLYPEQRKGNNIAGCFNWFQIGDTSRGLGELLSIREMVATAVERHKVDPAKVFVTGLSAGGAMTAALLAEYPDVFSAGAVIAGLPCGAASSAQEAFEAMARPKPLKPAALGDMVRAGAPHAGSWPRVAIWHGSADTTVAPANADELVKQWADVHGVAVDGFREERRHGNRRRVWTVEGRDVLQSTLVTGLGHGAPLDGRLGEQPGPFMLEAGVSSTREIASFFGLDDAKGATRPASATETAKPDASATSAKSAAGAQTSPHASRPTDDAQARRPTEDAPDERQSSAGSWGSNPFASLTLQRFDVTETITRALRSAGLMK